MLHNLFGKFRVTYHQFEASTLLFLATMVHATNESERCGLYWEYSSWVIYNLLRLN